MWKSQIQLIHLFTILWFSLRIYCYTEISISPREVQPFVLACCHMFPDMVSKNLPWGEEIDLRDWSYCEAGKCIKILFPLESSCFLIGGPSRVSSLSYQQTKSLIQGYCILKLKEASWKGGICLFPSM